MTDTLTDDITAQLDTLLDRLGPQDIDPAKVEAVLAEAQASLPWTKIHTGLLERIERLDTARDRMALVLHATDADVAGAGAGKRGLDGVFEVVVAAADDHALDTFLSRALKLVEDWPALHGDLPSVDRLLEICDQIEADHESSAEQLVTLAQRIEDILEQADA